MSAYIPQMGTRSEVRGNTAQSSCTKRCAISNNLNSYKNKDNFNNNSTYGSKLSFKNIKTYGSKLSLKQDHTFHLFFKNVNGLPPDMGYCASSWKYRRLQQLISRFQVDAVCLAETQINPVLVPYTFLIRDKLFRNKESVSILANNKQEHLGVRQQGGVFTGITGSASCIAISSGTDPTGLERWSWVQLKGQTTSTYIITTYQCIESRSTVGIVFLQ